MRYEEFCALISAGSVELRAELQITSEERDGFSLTRFNTGGGGGGGATGAMHTTQQEGGRGAAGGGGMKWKKKKQTK